MAANVYLKDLDSSYFKIQGTDIVRVNFLNYLTRFFILNPTTVSVTLGGDKNSVFTESQIRTNFQFDVSPPTITIPNEFDYQSVNWLSKGWTASDRTTFLQEVKTWLLNNLDTGPLNPFPATAGFIVHYLQGPIQGTEFSYQIPLIGYGNTGPLL